MYCVQQSGKKKCGEREDNKLFHASHIVRIIEFVLCCVQDSGKKKKRGARDDKKALDQYMEKRGSHANKETQGDLIQEDLSKGMYHPHTVMYMCYSTLVCAKKETQRDLIQEDLSKGMSTPTPPNCNVSPDISA